RQVVSLNLTVSRRGQVVGPREGNVLTELGFHTDACDSSCGGCRTSIAGAQPSTARVDEKSHPGIFTPGISKLRKRSSTDTLPDVRCKGASMQTRLSNGFPIVVAAVILASLLISSAYAQTTYGSIVGTIRDASGGAVPGVTVTVTNEATNNAMSA